MRKKNFKGRCEKRVLGKGVIEPDCQERGAHDYRKDACLTMTDFEKIVLHCIVYYSIPSILPHLLPLSWLFL